jgi:protein SCO1/2
MAGCVRIERIPDYKEEKIRMNWTISSVNESWRRNFKIASVHCRPHVLLVVLLAMLGAGLGSCSKTKSPAEKRFPFTGRVISIDQTSQSAVIDGDAVPGFMDAMAMTYKVKNAGELTKVSVGDSIAADVVVANENYWLENVKVTRHTTQTSNGPAAGMHVPAPGEEVPDFQFTNQSGKLVSLKQYRGRILLLTFIYTRCPFPDFCPRMSKNFAEIYHQIGNDAVLSGKTHLLSISFDPAHDTPRLLRDYGFSVAGTKQASLFECWEFVAPRAADLPEVANYFALAYKPEGGLITHTLSSAVIGPDGKIVQWYHGGDWQPSELIRDATDAALRRE